MMTKKDFSIQWLKSHHTLLISFGCIEVFSMIFALVFNWGSTGAFYYLFLLGLFLCFILFILLWHDWRKYKSMVKALNQQTRVLEEDYSPVIHLLFEKNQDLTQEMQQLKTKMQQSRKEDIDYYTLWAHQIKTSIASSQLLIRSLPQTAEKSMLEQELVRITAYTELALHYVRMETFHRDLDLQKVKLDDILHPVIKKYATFFIHKKLKLQYIPIDEVVVTDKKWLGVIVEQVLSNAVKYTPDEGRIEITFDKDILTIKDTGIGIASHDQTRIFERGFSGFNGRVNHQSTGLGLYLSSEIAKKLGVTLSVDSTVGEGTAIHIQIPKEGLQVKD